MKIERQYDYKPKWSTVIFAGGFFGLCTALFVYLGVTNDRGLVINGLIHLSPSGAKVFYGALALASFAFVLGAVFIAYVRLTTAQRIAITADGILFPAGRRTSRECHVRFESITDLKQSEIHGQIFLYVYADGLRYTVVKNMLPTKGDFDDIVSVLETRMSKRGSSNKSKHGTSL